MFGVLESSVDGIKLGILDNNEKYHILVETSDYLIKYPFYLNYVGCKDRRSSKRMGS